MITQTQPALDAFADWIRANDPHASHHLALIDAVRRVKHENAADRLVLSTQLRRWRYQHLNAHADRLLPKDEAFLDSLDRTANDLAGRKPLAPRRTHQALVDAISIEEWLHSSIPLENLAERAQQLTESNFRVDDSDGTSRRRMLLYAPIYVSSRCVNDCAYCGFRSPRDIKRKHLSLEETLEQARVLHGRGFRHVLVVAGDFPSQTSRSYFCRILEALVAEGMTPAVEIAPRSLEGYAALADAGACGVTLYQETYDERLYAKYHVKGPKRSFAWRLEGHDRAAEAGIGRHGLGVLLGLAEPREDVAKMLRHASYLAERFPHRTLAFSLPRIHKAPAGFSIPHPVSDEELIRLYCLLRLAFPRSELVLSTRESAALRNRLAKLCITQLSAGSSTSPGGYQSQSEHPSEQFPVTDSRNPSEVATWLESVGIQPLWDVYDDRTQARPPD